MRVTLEHYGRIYSISHRDNSAEIMPQRQVVEQCVDYFENLLRQVFPGVMEDRHINLERDGPDESEGVPHSSSSLRNVVNSNLNIIPDHVINDPGHTFQVPTESTLHEQIYYPYINGLMSTDQTTASNIQPVTTGVYNASTN